MSGQRVGGEVDGYCTKCKMILAHTILAMVGERIARVRCNTCYGEHAHKTGLPGEAKPSAAKKPRAAKATSSRSTKSAGPAMSFEEQLASKNVADARTYAPATKFALNELISHPTFGLGIVGAARADKIDVTFRGSVKTLLHNRYVPAAKPVASEPESEQQT